MAADAGGAGGSGGIMNSMKAAIQHTGLIGGRTTPSDHPAPKKVVKDGSAHPHPKSDAQVSIDRIFQNLKILIKFCSLNFSIITLLLL